MSPTYVHEMGTREVKTSLCARMHIHMREKAEKALGNRQFRQRQGYCVKL